MQLALASADSPGFVGGGGRTNSVPPVVGYTYKYKYALINISIRVDISDWVVGASRDPIVTLMNVSICVDISDWVVGASRDPIVTLINISIRVDISDSCVAGHRQFCGRDENIYQVGWQCVLELFISSFFELRFDLCVDTILLLLSHVRNSGSWILLIFQCHKQSSADLRRGNLMLIAL